MTRSLVQHIRQHRRPRIEDEFEFVIQREGAEDRVQASHTLHEQWDDRYLFSGDKVDGSNEQSLGFQLSLDITNGEHQFKDRRSLSDRAFLIDIYYTQSIEHELRFYPADRGTIRISFFPMEDHYEAKFEFNAWTDYYDDKGNEQRDEILVSGHFLFSGHKITRKNGAFDLQWSSLPGLPRAD